MLVHSRLGHLGPGLVATAPMPYGESVIAVEEVDAGFGVLSESRPACVLFTRTSASRDRFEGLTASRSA